MNFVDPSGRIAAGEYGQMALNSLKNGIKVAAVGFVVRCSIFTLASSVELVGEHIGLRLDQLAPNFNTCAATETASRVATDVAVGFGLGVIGEGVGWLLDDAVEGAMVGPELEGAAGGGRGLSFATTDGVPATNWQSYESGIRGMYGGEQAFQARQFAAILDGEEVNGVADAATTVNGTPTAVDAKYVNNWETSLRNPASPIGQSPFALAEQLSDCT